MEADSIVNKYFEGNLKSRSKDRLKVPETSAVKTVERQSAVFY